MESARDAVVQVPLPEPLRRGGMPLNEALARRRSHREFAPRPLSREQVSQLCWAAQGISGVDGLRTAPSAGALYGIALFLVTDEGVFEYRPSSHALRRKLDGDLRRPLQSAALDQECVADAPVCMVIAIDVGRMASKYGRRAERYCLLEAGHAAQNVLLAATAMDLGGVPVGAFEDHKVAGALNFPKHWQPVYLLPLGHPKALTPSPSP